MPVTSYQPAHRGGTGSDASCPVATRQRFPQRFAEWRRANRCLPCGILNIIVQRQPFDSGYVQRLAESDPETVDDFVRHFSPLLAAKVRRRGFSGERVQEATQETFRRVLGA